MALPFNPTQGQERNRPSVSNAASSARAGRLSARILLSRRTACLCLIATRSPTSRTLDRLQCPRLLRPRGGRLCFIRYGREPQYLLPTQFSTSRRTRPSPLERQTTGALWSSIFPLQVHKARTVFGRCSVFLEMAQGTSHCSKVERTGAESSSITAATLGGRERGYEEVGALAYKCQQLRRYADKNI